MASPDQFPRNRLLAALPLEDFARLQPVLEPLGIELRQVLHRPNEPITDVYFLESGWVSMLMSLEDGDGAEVGLIGREGVVGLPVLLRAECDDLEAMVQAPGTALRLSTAAFHEACDHSPAFRDLMLHYALAHHTQVAMTAACNGRHHTEQRLARWLLMGHDRSDGDTYPMTHEFLSMMLGLRRAGITVAAGSLQRAGLIRYSTGRITITDRAGLENASCECYGVTRRAFDRLSDPNIPPGRTYRR